jgi:hypothetical protein
MVLIPGVSSPFDCYASKQDIPKNLSVVQKLWIVKQIHEKNYTAVYLANIIGYHVNTINKYVLMVKNGLELNSKRKIKLILDTTSINDISIILQNKGLDITTISNDNLQSEIILYMTNRFFDINLPSQYLIEGKRRSKRLKK